MVKTQRPSRRPEVWRLTSPLGGKLLLSSPCEVCGDEVGGNSNTNESDQGIHDGEGLRFDSAVRFGATEESKIRTRGAFVKDVP